MKESKKGKEKGSKTPKGTQDYTPEKEKKRQSIIAECENIFLLYGAERIDTPTFELSSVLMEKYGDREKEKEIFNLENKGISKGEDEGKEKCSLRYDLTVPFARYVKEKNITKMKRYQIGKVFRRDQPGKHRLREFYQCDYDNLGNGEKWLMDAETLILLISILRSLKEKYQLPNYLVKVNSRNNLTEIFKKSNISSDLFSTVCSSIDKLDKVSWDELVGELEKKGLSETQIISLKENLALGVENETLSKTLNAVKSTLNIQEDTDGEKEIEVDYTLARGLDYYTDLIFEVVLTYKEVDESGQEKNKSISIAGGGRYDSLCKVPCVGFSLGIDRISPFCHIDYDYSKIYTVWITTNKCKDEKIRESLSLYKLKVTTLLRNRGINVGIESKVAVNNGEAVRSTADKKIPYIIFLGEDELEKQIVTVKTIATEDQIKVSLEELKLLNF